MELSYTVIISMFCIVNRYDGMIIEIYLGQIGPAGLEPPEEAINRKNTVKVRRIPQLRIHSLIQLMLKIEG